MTIHSLNQIGIEVADMDRWQPFLADLIGIRCDVADSSITAMLDGNGNNIRLTEGTADDLQWIAFRVDSATDLEAIRSSLLDAGHRCDEGDPALCRARGVNRALTTSDPNGLTVEFHLSEEVATEETHSPVLEGGFVTGDGGLGHVVFGAAEQDVVSAWYEDLLGFRLSDTITTELAPELVLNVRFLHVNPRHHSVAIANFPLPKRIEHFMIELENRTDLGRAYERLLDAGYTMTRSLGEHPNDGVLSFYVRSPSGFDIEVGYGGILVDDATWEVREWDRISNWGHRPPQEAHS